VKKRAFWLAAFVLFLSLLAGGVSLALFTASAQNAAKTFTAGTVSIEAERDFGESVPGPMFYTTPQLGQVPSGPHAGEPGIHPTGLWVPGDSHVRNLIVKNTGSLRAKVVGLRAECAGSEDLKNALQVKVVRHIDSVTLFEGPLSALCGPGWVQLLSPTVINPGGFQDFQFVVTLPLEAGNECQEDNLAAQFLLYAEQTKNN